MATTKSTTSTKKKTSSLKTKTAKKPKSTTTKNSKTANAKKETNNTKFSTFKKTICDFLGKIDKAYYVALMAVISTILFFMPWLNVTFLTNLFNTLHINFLSGFFAIPQTLLSFFFSIDSQINGLIGIIDKLSTVSNNLDSLHDIAQYVNLFCSSVGLDPIANPDTVNTLISAIQNALPSADQLVGIKQNLTSIGSYAKTGSVVSMLLVLTIVGFNAYTAIICFAKKKITKGCVAAFIIEGAFAFLFMLICFSVNSVVQSLVFFLPNILEVTGWAWLALIVCIAGIIVSVKYKNKK